MTHSIVILRYQPSQKLSRNSVCKDIATEIEEHPNNLAANFMKARGIVKRGKKQIY
jgi:hypothetical protein